MGVTATFVSREKASSVAFREKEWYIDACCMYAMQCSLLTACWGGVALQAMLVVASPCQIPTTGRTPRDED
jgi:hypothetical protein